MISRSSGCAGNGPNHLGYAFSNAIDDLISAENVGALEADWAVISGDIAVATAVRAMLVRRRRWCGDFNRMYAALRGQVLQAYEGPSLLRCRSSCFGRWTSDGQESFEVPLKVEPARRPSRGDQSAHFDGVQRRDAPVRDLSFDIRETSRHQPQADRIGCLQPDANPHELSHRLIGPHPIVQKGKSARVNW